MPRDQLKNDNIAGNLAFLKMPKKLFTSEVFVDLSISAKVLVSMMLERVNLSKKNNWYSEDGRVYIIFTIEEIQQRLGCGKKKAINVLKELDTENGIGLVEKKQRGQGKANLLYINNLDDVFTSIKPKDKKSRRLVCEKTMNQKSVKRGLKESKNDTSRSSVLASLEVSKMESNKNNINNNKTERDKSISSYQSSCECASLAGKIDWVQNKNKWREILKRNISYEYFVVDGYPYKDEVDELINIMAEVMVMPEEETIRIERKNVQVAIVQDQFLQYEQRHIEYVLNCLKHNKTKITNIKSYLRTALYNAPLTVDNHCRAEVNYNLSKKYGLDR